MHATCKAVVTCDFLTQGKGPCREKKKVKQKLARNLIVQEQFAQPELKKLDSNQILDYCKFGTRRIAKKIRVPLQTFWAHSESEVMPCYDMNNLCLLI